MDSKSTKWFSKYLSGPKIVIAFIVFVLWGCNSTNTGPGAPAGDWLIPRDQVVNGGPGKDGIPSIDEPRFALAGDTDFIPDERRVVGIKIGDLVRAYPHQIMDWHEIVNDQLGDTPVAITFCPLTGTAVGWNRQVNGTVTEFGVSGLLFRNNLIPYDRNTDSNWSQMQMRSVMGGLQQTNINIEYLIETTWKTWKKMYPESEVLTTQTGFSRNYSGFAYGEGYSTNNSTILFPIVNENDRLPGKERVHSIIADQPASEDVQVRAYPVDAFGQGVRLIRDQLEGTNVVIAGSSEFDFSASFETVLPDGTELNLQAVQNALPVVMQDDEGNRWDIFGYAVEGPRQGSRLTPTLSYTGYWFAWADFFPDIEIHKPN